jgi:ubiquinone biosynthesis monooxygenase Coq6
MKVWDWFSDGKIAFDAQDLLALQENSGRFADEVQPLGYIVENSMLQACLVQSGAEAGVEWITGMLKSVDLSGADQGRMAKIAVERKDTGEIEEFETSLLVGADGGNSLVKRVAGLESFGINYPQVGVVASVELEEQDSTAWQRFLPLGPLALLPSFGNFASLVWSTSPAHAKHLLKLDESDFIRELNRAYTATPDEFGRSRWFKSILPEQFESLLPLLHPGKFTPPTVTKLVSKRASFPLRIQHSSSYISDRVALIGDAAHIVHPLAGQGVNLGFEDADALCRCIAESLEVGSDIGNLLSLEKYDNQQRRNNALKMAGIHAIQRVFSIQNGPIALARGIGLDIVNSIPSLKQTFADIATGKL